MNFKTIKSLDEEEFNGLYEMSEDGKIVQSIKDKLPLRFDESGARVKVELHESGSSQKKSFGIKTLYWSSWGNPLPGGTAKPAKAAPAKASTTAPAAVKPKKAYKGETSLTTKDNQLLSKYILGKVNSICQLRLSMKTTADMCEINDTKELLGRIIFHNPKNGLVLVNLFNANWREGYWFLNPKTGAYLKFDEAKHKPGYGTDKIIWPESLA